MFEYIPTIIIVDISLSVTIGLSRTSVVDPILSPMEADIIPNPYCIYHCLNVSDKQEIAMLFACDDLN